jgi:hypothetical protein
MYVEYGTSEASYNSRRGNVAFGKEKIVLVALPVVRVQMEAEEARNVLLHKSFYRRSIVNRIVILL